MQKLRRVRLGKRLSSALKLKALKLKALKTADLCHFAYSLLVLLSFKTPRFAFVAQDTFRDANC